MSFPSAFNLQPENLISAIILYPMSATPFIELIVLFLAMILQVIIPPLPAELIIIEGGRRFGMPLTTLFGGTGLLVGSTAVYFFGSYLHRRFQRFFDKDRTKRVVERLRRYENVLLWIRVLPYNPSDLISYGAGILKLDLRKFILVTACTSYIRTMLLALMGARLSNAREIFQIIFLLFLSWVIATIVIYGRKKPKKNF